MKISSTQIDNNQTIIKNQVIHPIANFIRALSALQSANILKSLAKNNNLPKEKIKIKDKN